MSLRDELNEFEASGDTHFAGDLDLRDYPHPLPTGLTSVGGKLRLRDYKYDLPAGLTSVGGGLDLYHYEYPLPAGLTSVGGDLVLYDYKHPLPAGLTRVHGLVGLYDYGVRANYPLPKGLTSVGGDLDLRDYPHPLPTGLTSVGGDLVLEGYPHPLPAGLVVSGGLWGTDNYSFPLPRLTRFQEHYSISTPATANFRRWFGNSKVVSSDGSPAVVYHGTYRGGFSRFDPAKIDPHHPGFYFSDELQVASSYSKKPTWPFEDPTPELGSPDKTELEGAYRLFLSLQNPAVVDCEGSEWSQIEHPDFPGLYRTYDIAKEAKRRGYDGVIFKNIWDHGGRSGSPKLGTVYVAFEPTQIKSALFNTGEFSSTDPDIRKNPRRTSRRKTSKRARRKTSRSRA